MKKVFYLLSLVAMVVMTSCTKPIEAPEGLNVNPNPLTVVGGKINASITGTFPAKKFVRNGVLTITPVLKYNGKEAVGTPVTYIGEKVKENGKKVSYKNGGKYTQTCSFDYVPEMAKCELYLRCVAKKGKKTYEVPDVKVADGVIATSMLADANDNQAVPTPSKYQTVVEELQEADIKFLVAQTNLRQSELGSEAMKALEAAINDANKAKNKSVSKVEISGYASPEGGLDLNERLATNRQANTEKYIKGKVKGNADYVSSTTAEDWEGFQEILANSNIQDKELVLRILSMYSDPEEREAQIRNLSVVFKDIAADVLPQLRRSRILVTTAVVGKSDEEILNLARTDADQLDVEEYLYAAAVAPTTAEQLAIYEKVAEKYGDYRAYNNMGMIYFNNDQTAEADKMFKKALAIAPKNADVNYNAALTAMAEGKLNDAEAYLGKAAGTKGDLNGAMATLYTLKGDYNNASKLYGTAHSNNAALQQILNQDYASAQNTLDNISNPNAKTAYLKAVLGARTNDREAVYTNLRAAVSQDAQYKATAKTDMEFAKYAEDAKFQAIIK